MATEFSRNASADSPSTKVDHFIEQELIATTRRFRTAEVARGMLAVVAWGLGSLILLVLIDSWIFPLSGTVRTGGLLLMLGGSAVLFFRLAMPAIFRRINPRYVARIIEGSSDSFHNSLLNYLILRGNREKTKSPVYEAVSRRAATDLSAVDAEQRLDYSALIRMAILSACLFAVLAAYLVFSPRNPWASLGRILMPAADIAPASIVSVTNVRPGDTSLYFGDPLYVYSTVRGLRDRDRVQIVYSSLDGQIREARVDMTASEIRNEFTGMIDLAGTGVTSDLTYSVIAGDGSSPQYSVTVRPNPTIRVSQVQVSPPSYTGLPVSTFEGRGGIRAAEGSRVRIEAATNQDIKIAWIELVRAGVGNANNNEDVAVVQTVELLPSSERTAAGEFVLVLNRNRDSQPYSHYRLRFRNLDDARNDQASLHPIQIIPDQAPEVEIVRPEEKEVAVPLNGDLTVEVRAADIDYAISGIQLVLDRAGNRLNESSLEFRPERSGHQFNHRFSIRPEQLRLKEGDVVVYFARALDNRVSPYNNQPDPNQSVTESYRFIVGPEQTRQGDGKTTDQKQNPEANPPVNPGTKNQDTGNSQQPQTDSQQNAGREGQSSDDTKGQQQEKGESSTQGSEQGDVREGAGESERNSGEMGGQGGSGENSGQSDTSSEGETGAESKEGESGSSGAQTDDSQSAGNRGQGADSSTGQRSDGSNSSSEQKQGASDQANSGGDGNTSEGMDTSSGADSNSAERGSSTGGMENNAADSRTGGANGGQKSEQGSEAASGGQDGGQSDEGAAGSGVRSDGSGNNRTSGESNPEGNSGGEPSSGEAGDGINSGQGSRDDSLKDGKVEPLSKQSSVAEQWKALSDYVGDDATPGENSDGVQRNQQSGSGNETVGQNPNAGTDGKSEKNGDRAGRSQSSKDNAANPGARGSDGGEPTDDGARGDRSATPDNISENSSQSRTGEAATREGIDGGGKPLNDKASGADSEPDQTEKSGANESNGEGATGSSGGKEDGLSPSKGNNEASEGVGAERESGQNDSVADRQQEPKETSGRASETKQGSGEPGQIGEMQESGQKGEGSRSGNSNDLPNTQSSSGETPKGQPGETATPDEFANPAGSGNDSGSARSGTGSGIGTGTRSSGNSGAQGEPDDVHSGMDRERMEYNKSATDLILKRLEDQMDAPDRELLERMNWTESEMREFVERWKAMRDAADSGDTGAKNRYDEALRSLGLRRPGSELRKVESARDEMSGMSQDGGINRPPAELAPEFNAFMKSRSQKSGSNRN